MAFTVPPNGTRGARQPGGAFARVGSRLMAGFYRLLGGAGTTDRVLQIISASRRPTDRRRGTR
jgi:hypothetical protein